MTELLVLSVACWALLPLSALFGPPTTNRRRFSVFIAAGAIALLGALLGPAASSSDLSLPSPFSLGAVAPAFRLDPLARWFLAAIAVVALCLSPCLNGYMAHDADHVDMRQFWIALPLLLASMAGVVLAANAQTFLVAWELMSLTSFLLVLTERRQAEAALVYLGATRVGTAFLAGGFVWACHASGSWNFADWRLSGASALGPGLCILIGLAVKAGSWPFHLWLPLAHPAAPSPVSALMSGVMVKIGLYGMARFLVVDPRFIHPAFGHVMLALGAISAFWGVIFALLQQDVKCMLAYSTVENVGLVMLGFGLAVVCPPVAPLALGAALFHVWNHAAFKSLLFLAAGAVDQATGLRDLERLGGLGRRMPYTFVAFLVGAAAICALPPLNGFASEWLLYQSFLGGVATTVPLHRFLALGTLGWLALVGTLALACFTRATAAIFLGLPRCPQAEQADAVPMGMRIAQALLIALCVLLGTCAPAVLQAVRPLTGGAVVDAWTVPLPAVLVALIGTAACAAMLLARSRVRVYQTWECGFGPLTPRMQISASSFAQPTARLFAALYRYVVAVRVEGQDRRHFPDVVIATPHTRSILASLVYLPVLRAIDRMAAGALALQAGSIHVYLFTMFLTLCILIAVGATLQ